MQISTLSYYTTELYKEFAAYTTEKLHELGLNFGQMYFIIYVGKHPECCYIYVIIIAHAGRKLQLFSWKLCHTFTGTADEICNNPFHRFKLMI